MAYHDITHLIYVTLNLCYVIKYHLKFDISRYIANFNRYIMIYQTKFVIYLTAKWTWSRNSISCYTIGVQICHRVRTVIHFFTVPFFCLTVRSAKRSEPLIVTVWFLVFDRQILKSKRSKLMVRYASRF